MPPRKFAKSKSFALHLEDATRQDVLSRKAKLEGPSRKAQAGWRKPESTSQMTEAGKRKLEGQSRKAQA